MIISPAITTRQAITTRHQPHTASSALPSPSSMPSVSISLSTKLTPWLPRPPPGCDWPHPPRPGITRLTPPHLGGLIHRPCVPGHTLQEQASSGPPPSPWQPRPPPMRSGPAASGSPGSAHWPQASSAGSVSGPRCLHAYAGGGMSTGRQAGRQTGTHMI